MFTKHFFKMLLGLIIMIAIGLIGLVIINSLEAQTAYQRAPADSVSQ